MENTNMTEQTQGENMGNNEPVQAAEGNEKLFTQEDVNSFVQARISRLKGQLAKEAKAEYDQKLAELQAREMKLTVKEKLAERGMPKELADVITCADEKDIEAKLDTLQRIYGNEEKKTAQKGFLQVGAEGRTGAIPQADPIRKAMGLE